jgi:hypothetical protein
MITIRFKPSQAYHSKPIMTIEAIHTNPSRSSVSKLVNPSESYEFKPKPSEVKTVHADQYIRKPFMNAKCQNHTGTHESEKSNRKDH